MIKKFQYINAGSIMIMIMTTAELCWPESCTLLWEEETIWDTSLLNKFK